MSDRFYVTTPLYYVNDAPHIGHAYTTVAADIAARFHRLLGRDVHFLTGTDEHGQKVWRKAAERGLSPQAHADELHRRFTDLWARLDITHDDFIRTTEPRHTEVVQQVLAELHARGDIYPDVYEGWYSTAAERFWTEKDLIDGRCPDTGQPVEWIQEKNWFFRMSRYADALRDWVRDHPEWVAPEARRNELLGALRQDIGDLCISRPKARLPWGIPIPFDPDYVTYVWFDALLNYITAVGYARDEAGFARRWPADLQLLGKDILTTHTVYWGTMLLALGLAPARRLIAHGWWTVEGQKMSKSLGNVVDPNLLVDAYGADAVRWVLMSEKALGPDGDFSHRGFQLRYNAELANDIGNLLHRGTAMTERWLGGRVPPRGPSDPADGELGEGVAAEVDAYIRHMHALEVNEAAAAVVRVAQLGNKYIDTQRPWTLHKDGSVARLGEVMRLVLELCRVVGVLLAPFCPTRSGELLARLGVADARLDAGTARLTGLADGHPVTHGDPLFPRMMELPPAIVEALEKVSGEAALRSLAAEHPPHQEKKKPPRKAAKAPPPPAEIAYEDFARVQLKAGRVVSAALHPDAQRLLVLEVEVGEARPRQIVAGIASRYTPEELLGLNVVVVANLAPAELRGVRSEGMLLAAGADGVEAMVTTLADVAPGTVIR